MRPQPLIAVRDVEASSRFYCALLGAESGHGGALYERVMHGGQIVLQLHLVNDGDDDHPNLEREAAGRRGHGVLLWFESDDLEGAVARARQLGADILKAFHYNANAGHRELWLRDLDGYHVVIAGP